MGIEKIETLKLEEEYREEQKKSGVLTSLGHKHWEPLVVRRFVTKWGCPLFIGLICGDDISDLDEVLDWYQSQFRLPENIQEVRNWVGRLTEILSKIYNSLEGVGVVLYADKMTVSSLLGDFMNCYMCRQEFYYLLNFMCHV